MSANGPGNLPTVRGLFRLLVLQGDGFNSPAPSTWRNWYRGSRESAFLEIANLQVILHMHKGEQYFKGSKSLFIKYMQLWEDIGIVQLLNNLL